MSSLIFFIKIKKKIIELKTLRFCEWTLIAYVLMRGCISDFRYSKDSSELQMRRLADLAFLFQLYDFAYQTYHTAKRDFNNDHAWLHYAGALVCSLSNSEL